MRKDYECKSQPRTNHVYGATSSCRTCHLRFVTDFDGTTTGHSGTSGTEDPDSTDTHGFLDSASNCTTDCHGGPSVTSTEIQTTIHTTCQACHVSATDGSFADGTDSGSPANTTVLGVATNHSKGVASSCTACHSETGRDYSTDYTVHTADTHSSRLVVTGAAKCTDCHGTAVSDAAKQIAPAFQKVGSTPLCRKAYVDS